MREGPLTIGILGGMSWESSAEYYRLANELVRERLGGLHSARVLLASVDFADIEALQVAGDWDGTLRAANAHRTHYLPSRAPDAAARPAGPGQRGPVIRSRADGADKN